jgi:hypothetical protein
MFKKFLSTIQRNLQVEFGLLKQLQALNIQQEEMSRVLVGVEKNLNTVMENKYE